jgi:hypothetical protein
VPVEVLAGAARQRGILVGMTTSQSVDNSRWWLYGLGATAAVGLLATFSGRRYRKPQELVIESRPHVVNAAGIVEADPDGLARAAHVPLDLYVLASTMESEEHSDRARLAVGRAVWNKVRADRSKLVGLLIPSGRLGSQTVNPYAATTRAPSERTLVLAATILEGKVPDFVKGATQWDAPKTQDRLHQLYLRDPAKYRKHRFNSKDIAAKRSAAGAREVRLSEVPNTRFWTYRQA